MVEHTKSLTEKENSECIYNSRLQVIYLIVRGMIR
jgi:hypothetical protein